jgi:hypothetical protein
MTLSTTNLKSFIKNSCMEFTVSRRFGRMKNLDGSRKISIMHFGQLEKPK